MKHQLRWAGHCVQIEDISRIPKQVFYCQLSHGKRSQDGQRKCFKNILKAHLKRGDIDPASWDNKRFVLLNTDALLKLFEKGIRVRVGVEVLKQDSNEFTCFRADGVNVRGPGEIRSDKDTKVLVGQNTLDIQGAWKCRGKKEKK